MGPVRGPERRRRSHATDLPALGRLLALIDEESATSRVGLARKTGLARSTVSQLVDLLIDKGLLLEDEERADPPATGRPPQRLRLAPNAGVILAADLDVTQTRVAIADFARTIVARDVVEIDIGKGPDEVLGLARERLTDLLVRSGHTTADVRAVGVSVVGPVEHSTGTVINPPIMPGWNRCNITKFFDRFVQARVVVDNDVNLMAIAEHRFHYRSQRVEHLLFVRVDTGIGCGIISQNGIHRGVHGAAGDIGHIRVPGDDSRCSCSKTGCLEAVASGAALARDLAADGHDVHTTEDVACLVESGNHAALSAVRVASRHIGDVLAGLVSFYNPAVIVFGGPLARLQEVVLAGIHTRIYDSAVPLATRSLRIEASKIGEEPAITGAVLAAHLDLIQDGLTSFPSMQQ